MMRVVFAANVVVAGVAGGALLFGTRQFAAGALQDAAEITPAVRIIGAFWLAIAVASALGCWRPLTMSPIFLIQLLYKGSWLLIVAAPALLRGRPETLPLGIAVFFLIWVLVLPFVIPWRWLVSGS